MKTKLLLPALTVPALLSFAGLQTVALRFAPAEGAAVTRSFRTVSQMELDAMEMLVGGNPLPTGADMEMSMKAVQSLTVTDEFGATKDGRLQGLVRTFDDIGTTNEGEVSAMGSAQPMNSEGTSPLESSAVQFKWNPETESYDTTYAEGEDGDADLLDDLEFDLDLTRFLPEGDLEIGGTYDIDPSALIEVLAPGGDLKIDMDGDMGMGASSPEMGDFRSYFKDSVEGDFTGKLIEVVESDGGRIAIIELKVDVVTSADLTEMMAELAKDGDLPAGMDMDIEKQLIDFAYEGEGTLRWHVGAGRLAGLELNGEVSLDMETAMAVQGQTMEMNMSMSGDIETVIEVQ